MIPPIPGSFKGTRASRNQENQDDPAPRAAFVATPSRAKPIVPAIGQRLRSDLVQSLVCACSGIQAGPVHFGHYFKIFHKCPPRSSRMGICNRPAWICRE